jgi:hypothetical protein
MIKVFRLFTYFDLSLSQLGDCFSELYPLRICQVPSQDMVLVEEFFASFVREMVRWHPSVLHQ